MSSSIFWELKIKRLRQKKLEERFDTLSAKFGSIEEIIREMGILFINPKKQMSENSVIDQTAKQFIWLWHRRKKINAGLFGPNFCSCGQKGKANFFLLPTPSKSKYLLTNSLALHCLLWHREEIPKEEMERLLGILSEIPEEEPTSMDLLSSVGFFSINFFINPKS